MNEKNAKLCGKQTKKFYTEDEQQVIEKAMATLKKNLVSSLSLLYDETELTQDERVAYAEREVSLLLSESLC